MALAFLAAHRIDPAGHRLDRNRMTKVVADRAAYAGPNSLNQI